MKKKHSLLNRLLSRFVSSILLLTVYLASAINPAAESANVSATEQFFALKSAAVDTTTTASNATLIEVSDDAADAPANPYPSQITIAGAVGKITNVTVVLRELRTGRMTDLDILLVGPGGQGFVLISDVTSGDSAALATLTLQDGGTPLPNDITVAPITTGTYRPTNNGNGESSFPSPAPAGPFNNPPAAPGSTCTGCTSTFASVYAQPGVPANGVWSLYVDDDGDGDGFTARFSQGWTLNVTTDNISVTAASVSVGGRVLTSNGRGIRNVQITMLDNEGNTRTAISNAFGYYRFADVPAGATYIFSVSAKRYTFSQPTKVQNIISESDGIDFVADN